MAFEPCNGPQNDVSVWEDLVFMSVDTPQTNPGLFVYVSSYGLTPGNFGPNCEQFHGKAVPVGR